MSLSVMLGITVTSWSMLISIFSISDACFTEMSACSSSGSTFDTWTELRSTSYSEAVPCSNCFWYISAFILAMS